MDHDARRWAPMRRYKQHEQIFVRLHQLADFIESGDQIARRGAWQRARHVRKIVAEIDRAALRAISRYKDISGFGGFVFEDVFAPEPGGHHVDVVDAVAL